VGLEVCCGRSDHISESVGAEAAAAVISAVVLLALAAADAEFSSDAPPFSTIFLADLAWFETRVWIRLANMSSPSSFGGLAVAADGGTCFLRSASPAIRNNRSLWLMGIVSHDLERDFAGLDAAATALVEAGEVSSFATWSLKVHSGVQKSPFPGWAFQPPVFFLRPSPIIFPLAVYPMGSDR